MISELVNFKRPLGIQNIMFCSAWGESCSYVHFAVNMAVVWSNLAFSTISTCLYIGEVVNIYELYSDSMCQFALLLMNK